MTGKRGMQTEENIFCLLVDPRDAPHPPFTPLPYPRTSTRISILPVSCFAVDKKIKIEFIVENIDTFNTLYFDGAYARCFLNVSPEVYHRMCNSY